MLYSTNKLTTAARVRCGLFSISVPNGHSFLMESWEFLVHAGLI